MVALERVSKWYGLRRGTPVLRYTRVVAAGTSELAERLAFTQFLTTRMADLSKGNCQKVALAQALLADPALLVLDEPWSGLDEGTKRELARILIDVHQRGSCVVLSEHTVTAFADRVLRIDNGLLTVHGGSLPAPTVLVELVRPDGTVLRSRVPRHQVDKLLAHALHDGLSVRRVEP